MIMLAEIINENGVLNGEVLGDIVYSGMWEGVKMFFEAVFSNPTTVLIIFVVIILGIISGILGIIVQYHKTRYWTKVRTKARLEEQDRYRAEKLTKKNKD